MNGAEHYAMAERELRNADDASIDDGMAAWHHARAQVHATLALAPKANDDEYWAVAKQLDELRAAVREYVVDVESGEKYDRLVRLAGGAS